MTGAITQAIDDMCLGIAQLSWYASGCDGDEGSEALQAAKKLMASMKALQELKASVPEDVPEVCFGNIDDEVADCDSKSDDMPDEITIVRKNDKKIIKEYLPLPEHVGVKEETKYIRDGIITHLHQKDLDLWEADTVIYEARIKHLGDRLEVAEKDFADMQEDYFALKKRLALAEENEKDASEGWAEAEEELQYLKDNPIENMLNQGYSMGFAFKDKEQGDE